jgi:hypothetical protein
MLGANQEAFVSFQKLAIGVDPRPGRLGGLAANEPVFSQNFGSIGWAQADQHVG